MSDFRLVFGPAKGALILCTLSMAFALAMGIWPAHYQKARKGAFAKSEKNVQGGRSEVLTLTADLTFLDTHQAAFKHLTSIGLIGDPERDLWVQKLEAIYKAMEFPSPLRYVLAAPQSLVDHQRAAAGALPPTPANALRHDLDLELSGLHEGEFLAFLDALRTDWPVPFRVEECELKRQPEAGLQIKCRLLLFSLPAGKDGRQADR